MGPPLLFAAQGGAGSRPLMEKTTIISSQPVANRPKRGKRRILNYWPMMRNAFQCKLCHWQGAIIALSMRVSMTRSRTAAVQTPTIRPGTRADLSASLLLVLALCASPGLRAEPFNLVIRSELHGADSAMAFAPLAEYLSEASGHQLSLHLPDSALAHWQAMGQRNDYDLILDEGHFTDYRVHKLGYLVLAKVSGVAGFSVVTGPATVFVEPDELYGEPVASPAPPSLAALRLAELFPDAIRAPLLVEVGSYDEGIRRVINGDVTAAVIPSSMVREHPQLNVVMSTQQGPGMALSASPAVPAEAREVIRRAFLASRDIDAGRRALASAGLDGFEPASAALYDGDAKLLRGTWGY